MYMNTTSLHIQIETDMKIQAQRTADELGLSLSAVIKALLKQFVRTKHLSVGIPEVPNQYMINALNESEEDYKAGRVTSFESGKEALSYLDSLIKDAKHK